MLLSVHSVGASFDNEPHDHTRAFPHATGIYPVEAHNNLDRVGPTLILVGHLSIVVPITVLS